MKFIEKIYNEDNLKDYDITENTIRSRALLINSRAEILMCYSNELSHYEFPGGHLESKETLIEGLKREITEETGIFISDDEIKPFYAIKYYCKNYHGTKNNRLVEIYYFIVKTDKRYNIDYINLDEEEKKENYECIYIPVDNLYKILVDNKATTKESNSALDDMITVWKEYMKNGRL